MINFSLIYTSLPQLIHGLRLTLAIAALSWLIGFVVGSILAFMQQSHFKAVRSLVTLYVTIIRGTPMLIHITFFYYVLPTIGLGLSAFWTAVIAIGMNSAAYVSQIIRSGINAVGVDQREAGRVLGFTPFQIAQYIVFPQALRIVLPALASEMITLIKDSSLASIIGVMELYKKRALVMNQTYDVISVFFIVGVLYLIMTSLVSLIISYLERKMGWYVQYPQSQQNI